MTGVLHEISCYWFYGHAVGGHSVSHFMSGVSNSFGSMGWCAAGPQAGLGPQTPAHVPDPAHAAPAQASPGCWPKRAACVVQPGTSPSECGARLDGAV